MTARFIGILLSFLLSLPVWAEMEMQLLENRFRVDPSIERITFMIYRDEGSTPVVLVRPDGTKYYAWRHPSYIEWYQEDGMDIVSVNEPMPGPWQAIGQVSPDNSIKLMTNLIMSLDQFPRRLYYGETLKFTARLTEEGEQVRSRDFLDRIKLQVIFTKAMENVESLPAAARPIPQVIGEFVDDGTMMDERAGDGTFTVTLPISVAPGKYNVRISSENGVFMRAEDQQVLVYPSPIMVSFIQGRTAEEPHKIAVEPEPGTIVPGSLAIHVEQTFPGGQMEIDQAQAMQDEETLVASITNGKEPGRYGWQGWLYATDAYNDRELIFELPEQSFAVQAELQLDRNLEEFRRVQEEKERLELEAKMAEERAAAQKTTMMIVIVTNVVILLLAIVIAIIIKKRRTAKMMADSMPDLDSPESS
ncbi:TIGR03503 family protein [Thaumasiovibrio subtropicus]|uniref:TIGR03503 family protein n=1 Tax=Thaumasiovibrio subtropicus TaxID=1891207 RepID=UPI000B35F259|nr:TIGR03503 family protein [Thaumasiovibrio subtropicus]